MEMLLSDFCTKFSDFLKSEAEKYDKDKDWGFDAKYADVQAINAVVGKLDSLTHSLLNKKNVMHKTKIHAGLFGFSER